MHVVALGLPRDPDQRTRDAYVAFFESLTVVIPCGVCAREYARFLRDTPPGLHAAVAGGPADLFAWTVDIHNKVSARLGKPPMTQEYVLEHYLFGETPRAGCERPGPGFVALAALVALLSAGAAAWAAVALTRRLRA
jgi:hypothetical protein